ncbi:MAG: DUF1499 domain-containing protein [Acidobacteriota bacterium]
MRSATRLFVLALGLGLLAFAVSLVLRARQSRGLAPAPDAATILSSAQLPRCPETPNCVSSQAADPLQVVEPFELDPSLDAAPRDELERLLTVARDAGGVVVERVDGFAHLEFTSPLFGFVDDIYLLLDETGERIDIRSASRVGSSDLGANRERVETLRAAFQNF